MKSFAEIPKRNHLIVSAACALIVLSASFLLPRLTAIRSVNADRNRVYELRIYHAVPGKLQVMESRFREKTSKILAALLTLVGSILFLLPFHRIL